MIKVVLCDDHAVVRRGIRDTISEAVDIQVVGEAGDYAELRGLLRSLREEAPGWANTLPALPRLLHRALSDERIDQLALLLQPAWVAGDATRTGGAACR